MSLPAAESITRAWFIFDDFLYIVYIFARQCLENMYLNSPFRLNELWPNRAWFVHFSIIQSVKTITGQGSGIYCRPAEVCTVASGAAQPQPELGWALLYTFKPNTATHHPKYCRHSSSWSRENAINKQVPNIKCVTGPQVKRSWRFATASPFSHWTLYWGFSRSDTSPTPGSNQHR